jgi:hypothetical protein
MTDSNKPNVTTPLDGFQEAGVKDEGFVPVIDEETAKGTQPLDLQGQKAPEAMPAGGTGQGNVNEVYSQYAGGTPEQQYYNQQYGQQQYAEQYSQQQYYQGLGQQQYSQQQYAGQYNQQYQGQYGQNVYNQGYNPPPAKPSGLNISRLGLFQYVSLVLGVLILAMGIFALIKEGKYDVYYNGIIGIIAALSLIALGLLTKKKKVTSCNRYESAAGALHDWMAGSKLGSFLLSAGIPILFISLGLLIFNTLVTGKTTVIMYLFQIVYAVGYYGFLTGIVAAFAGKKSMMLSIGFFGYTAYILLIMVRGVFFYSQGASISIYNILSVLLFSYLGAKAGEAASFKGEQPVSADSGISG